MPCSSGSQFRSADSQLRSAESQLASAESELTSAESELASAESELASAESELQTRRVRARLGICTADSAARVCAQTVDSEPVQPPDPLQVRRPDLPTSLLREELPFARIFNCP